MALHEALQVAADVGADKGAEKALGTLVDEQGNLVPAPTGAEIYAYFKSLNNNVANLLATNQQQEAAIAALQSQLAAAATSIDQLSGLLNSKAAASTVSTLSQRVTSLNTTLDGKANAADVAQQIQAITNLDTTQSQGLVALQQAYDQENGVVQGLLASVANQGTLLTGLRTDVDAKAPEATVSALSGRVTTLTSAVNDATSGLATKVSAADLANGLAGKVNTTELTAALAQKVSVSDYTSALASKVSTADFTTALSGKASTADLTNGLAGKLNTSTFTPYATALDNNTSGLSATYTLASAAKTAADTNTSGLATANTAIGNRLRKDQADSTPYSLGVPTAAGMDKAVQKSELVGGIQRPYRVFQNVGVTPVGAYVRTGQQAQVTDGLGLGQVYALTAVRLKTLTAPLVASIVKVYANGVEAYSTTVALASVPAVGKTLDLLAITGASPPADITLPALLTCSASSGTFEIITDGILK